MMEGVERIIQAAHVGGGNFPGEIGEGGAKLRKPRESGLPNDGDGIVGRKIVEVVGERNETQRINEAVGGVAGDDVHLMVEEGAINKAEVHDARRSRESKSVAIAPAAEAVGAFEKLIADADAPSGSKRRNVREFLQMQVPGVIGTNDHGERIFKAERFRNFQMKALGVELLDAAVNGGGIALRGFVEDGGEGRAGVLDVEVEVSCEKSFVNEERATEIGLANDGNAGAGFDVLREEFGEDHLLREELGTDSDFGLRRTAGEK